MWDLFTLATNNKLSTQPSLFTPRVAFLNALVPTAQKTFNPRATHSFPFTSSFFVVLPFDESSPRPSDNRRFRKVDFYSNVSHPPASVSLDFNMDSDIMDDSVFDSYGNESDVYTPEVVCFFLDGAIIPTTNSLSCL
jgi:hypothetical protein